MNVQSYSTWKYFYFCLFFVIIEHHQLFWVIFVFSRHFPKFQIIVGCIQSLPVISGHSQTFQVISGHFQSFSSLPVISGHYRSCLIISGHFRSLEDVSSHFRYFPVIRGRKKLFPVVSCHFRSLEIVSGPLLWRKLPTQSKTPGQYGQQSSLKDEKHIL